MSKCFIGVAVLAVCTGAFAQAPASTTLKMQSTWPASLTLQENFKIFAERVDKLTRGAAQDRRDAGRPGRAGLRGARRHAQEGARRRARLVASTGSARTRPRSSSPAAPGGTFGMDHIDYLGWMLRRRRPRAVAGVLPEGAQAQRVTWSRSCPSSPQAFGWFKRPIKNLADFKGMKCRQTGIAAEICAAHGHDHGQHARRRDHARRRSAA